MQIGAKVTGDEIDEGVLAGVAVHHLADGAHQEEHDDAFHIANYI